MSTQLSRPTQRELRCWAVLFLEDTFLCQTKENSDLPIACHLWKGVPIYWHGVRTLANCPKIDGLLLLIPEAQQAHTTDLVQSLVRKDPQGIPIHCVPQAASLTETLRNILEDLASSRATHIVLADARDITTTAADIVEICQHLEHANAVATVHKVAETIASIAETSIEQTSIEQTSIERVLLNDNFATLACPQAYARTCLEELLRKNANLSEGPYARVLAARVLDLGETIVPRYATPHALLTCPDDLPKEHKHIALSIGQGYDVHRYGGNRPFVLGGIPLPTDIRISAHSDGDVLLHALMDALLGAAGLGDIGEHFPPDDPAYDGISSTILLQEVLTLLAKQAIKVIHVDLTIIAQKPKIAPYRAQIQTALAKALFLPMTSVNVKATTEEKLGFTGRIEGIKATAIVLCQKELQ